MTDRLTVIEQLVAKASDPNITEAESEAFFDGAERLAANPTLSITDPAVFRRLALLGEVS